jgi:hypothetical protein
LFQGTYNASNDYEVPAGTTAVVFFDGAGAGAVAANVFNNAHFDNLNVVGDVTIGDDLSLQSDGAVINFGADADVNLTHVADTGLRLNAAMALEFRDGDLSINSSADGQLDIDADTEVEIVAPTVDIDASTAMTIDTAAFTVTGAVDFNTSLNVDGTVTADGLTVDGVGSFTTDVSTDTDILTFIGTSWGDDELLSVPFKRGSNILGKISVAAAGAGQSGVMRLYTGSGGTSTERIKIESSGDITFFENDGTTASFVYDANAGVTFNEAGSDRDFRVESDSNTHMLFVDAGNNGVGINTSAVDHPLEVLTTANDKGIVLKDGDNDLVIIQRENEQFGRIRLLDSSSTRIDISARGDQGFKTLSVPATFNEDGGDNDFRVESDSNTHMLFVDAGNNRVGINKSDPGKKLDINHDDSDTWGVNDIPEGLGITNTNTTAGTYTGISLNVAGDGANAAGVQLVCDHMANGTGDFVISNRDAGTHNENWRFEADGGILGRPENQTMFDVQTRSNQAKDNDIFSIQARGVISGSFTGTGDASMRFHAASSGGGNQAGNEIHFYTNENGFSGTTSTCRLKIKRSGTIQWDPQKSGETFNVNSGGDDNDFIVQSNNQSNMLVVDGGTDCVIIGGGAAIDTVTYFSLQGIANGDAGEVKVRTNGKNAFKFRNSSNGVVGSITLNASDTTYNTTSDRRLKDNIQPIADGTEKLMAMNPVSHTWIADPEAPAVNGFIAQEMQDIVPEAVSGDPDGEQMMSMDYGRITPVLVAALQDAHKKIEALEERLTELEAN